MVKVEANIVSTHKKHSNGEEMAMVIFIADLNNGKKESVTKHIPVDQITAYKTVLFNKYNNINHI